MSSDADTGIEKETISFLSFITKEKTPTMEIKYEISGSSFKTQLPIFQDGDAEDFLHFLFEFNQAKVKLGYTSGSKLESGIEQLLKGTARHEWNTIKTTVDPTSTSAAAFERRVDALKAIYIPDPAAITNQKNYMRRVRKNDKTTVPQFLDRLKHINMLLVQFPNAAPTDAFNAEEVKQLFYHAMPARWRTNFMNSGQNVNTTPLETLRTYMVQQEVQTDSHRKKVRENNQKKGSGTNRSQKKTRTYDKHSSSKSSK